MVEYCFNFENSIYHLQKRSIQQFISASLLASLQRMCNQYKRHRFLSVSSKSSLILFCSLLVTKYLNFQSLFTKSKRNHCRSAIVVKWSSEANSADTLFFYLWYHKQSTIFVLKGLKEQAEDQDPSWILCRKGKVILQYVLLNVPSRWGENMKGPLYHRREV